MTMILQLQLQNRVHKELTLTLSKQTQGFLLTRFNLCIYSNYLSKIKGQRHCNAMKAEEEHTIPPPISMRMDTHPFCFMNVQQTFLQQQTIISQSRWTNRVRRIITVFCMEVCMSHVYFKDHFTISRGRKNQRPIMTLSLVYTFYILNVMFELKLFINLQFCRVKSAKGCVTGVWLCSPKP